MKESKRTASHEPRERESEETPRILSSEEKRELILAHARSQTGTDPMLRATVWGGVMIAVAGIGFGWWWTVGTGIKYSMQGDSSEYQAITESLNEFTRSVKDTDGGLPDALSPTDQANANGVSDLMKAVLEGDGSTSQRNDLLSPRPPGSSDGSVTSTTSTTTQQEIVPVNSEASEKTQLIDPATPGLEPDLN
jgi:hypothetical protein